MAARQAAPAGRGQCKAFVVNHDADMLELLKVLVEEEQGCATQGAVTCDTCPSSFKTIKQLQPDVVILDFIHENRGPNWHLLDQLRADEATSSIPILAMSTSEAVVEQTLLSSNVRRVIAMPFDLRDLRNAMGEILKEPKTKIPPVPERPGAEAERAAADVLVDEARPIVAHWLQALAEIEPFKSQGPLRPREVVDRLPVLLWGAAVALRTAEPERLFAERGYFHQAALKHVEERRKQGVPVAALVREYRLLRNAIWQALTAKTPEKGWTAEDVFRIGELVHRALDELVAIAVDAYGTAEAREAT